MITKKILELAPVTDKYNTSGSTHNIIYTYFDFSAFFKTASALLRANYAVTLLNYVEFVYFMRFTMILCSVLFVLLFLFIC